MNRRMGGGGGGAGRQGGNRSSFSQQPFQSGGGGLNPWQGAGGNQGGLIPQLSNQSLALALTSLLQPQHQQQPPSLLSLNTAGGFSNNRDYGNRFSGGISRSRDNRRHEPYNKNRGGNFGRRRSPPRNQKNNQKSKTDNKKKDEKSEETNNAEDEDKKDSKRDWKDEKNTETKEGEEGEEKESGNKEGKYGGVPSKYLNCFVCNKQMWDGESMGKHVRGRAHHEMLKALEESIHICVNILRENLRLAEERKTIEYNRQNRQRKFGQRREPPMSHCAMCDLKFMGKIVSHRRSDGHQRLKRYLHPTCRMCDKEYPSRIEWIEHCLTPEHLKRVHDSTEKRLGGKDGDEIMETGEDAKEESEQQELDLEPLLDEALNMESEDAILEVDENLENLTSRLPAYKKDRPLATKSLSEFSGWKCDLCHRSFVDKDDADAHLKTRKHFYRFIEVIKDRHDREEKRKKAEKEAAQKAEEAAKAAKTREENGENEGEGEEENEEEGLEEEADEEVDGDQEMYDPSEATEEDQAANGEGEEDVETKMDVSVVKEEVKEEKKPEEKKPEVKTEVKKEPPAAATPAATAASRVTRKSVAGPKNKRGGKK